MGCWHGCLPGARCSLAYGPADATATHCLLLHDNRDWFYLSGTGSPGPRVVPDRGPLNECVCVYMCVLLRQSRERSTVAVGAGAALRVFVISQTVASLAEARPGARPRLVTARRTVAPVRPLRPDAAASHVRVCTNSRTYISNVTSKKVKAAHTRLPSVGFRS